MECEVSRLLPSTLTPLSPGRGGGARGAAGVRDVWPPCVCFITLDVEGHCDDDGGGAWTYRRRDGSCRHSEADVPRAGVRALPFLFPDVRSVIDFGGGPGGYLTGFRSRGVKPHDLITVEPHHLGKCLFAGVEQLTTDIFTEPVNRTLDMVMTVEVAEHIPSFLHAQLIDWLIVHTRRWLVFTAAHPGQAGEGHVGCKSPAEWRRDITRDGRVVFDQNRTFAAKRATRASILHTNLHVFRKASEHTSHT